MKRGNVSIFIPHVGCPHKCSFCDQRTISGTVAPPRGKDVAEICAKALAEAKSPENTEIAFFGGSFTATPREYMSELLEAAQPFVGEGRFRGIRCSTRPDAISREILDVLKSRGVTSIELGAQSMDDAVLEANERGHSSADVEKASALIKEYGFELGLQTMTGLYKSSRESDIATARSIIALAPETVRIYPVVVLEGTRLAELYKSGEYKLAPFGEMVGECAELLRLYADAGIKVIKCGLHASEFVERDMVAGYYHPAFRELCESLVYRENILADARAELGGSYRGSLTVAVNPRDISKAVGQSRANINYFKEHGIELRIVGDDGVPPYKHITRR